MKCSAACWCNARRLHARNIFYRIDDLPDKKLRAGETPDIWSGTELCARPADVPGGSPAPLLAAARNFGLAIRRRQQRNGNGQLCNHEHRQPFASRSSCDAPLTALFHQGHQIISCRRFRHRVTAQMIAVRAVTRTTKPITRPSIRMSVSGPTNPTVAIGFSLRSTGTIEYAAATLRSLPLRRVLCSRSEAAALRATCPHPAHAVAQSRARASRPAPAQAGYVTAADK